MIKFIINWSRVTGLASLKPEIIEIGLFIAA
jgi:hypothetical protein